MSDAEFTISRILRDPLIRQVLQADHVPLSDFAQLLRGIALSLRNDSGSSMERSQPVLSSCREEDEPAAMEGVKPVLF